MVNSKSKNLASWIGGELFDMRPEDKGEMDRFENLNPSLIKIKGKYLDLKTKDPQNKSHLL